MPALRIAVNALTLPSRLAGIGFYTHDLLRSLSAFPDISGVTLFTNAEAAVDFPSLPAKVEMVGIPVRGILAKVAWSQAALPRRLAGYDLLHSVGNVACLGARLPQVVTIHDLCNKVMPERFGLAKRLYLDWGISRTAARKNSILCVSESTRNDLLRYYPAAAGKAHAVHSACKFPIDEAGAGPRSGLLFVGTLEPGKNLAFALEVIAKMRSQGCPATLKVVGAKGWKQSHIPAVVERLGLKEAVEFAGYLDDAQLRAAYQGARALFFPSAYEGFGFPILEAQSQGCPVVSADNSCLREIGGDGSRYFRDGDHEGAASLLRPCLEEDSVSKAMRERGFGNCRRFSWERTARETLAVYHGAI